tara:strand:- start:39 stop:230 length:192 start_codon:yes stop_codon:yes gene_type:complete
MKNIDIYFKENLSDDELDLLDTREERKSALNELYEFKELVRGYLGGEVSRQSLEQYLALDIKS